MNRIHLKRVFGGIVEFVLCTTMNSNTATLKDVSQ